MNERTPKIETERPPEDNFILAERLPDDEKGFLTRIAEGKSSKLIRPLMAGLLLLTAAAAKGIIHPAEAEAGPPRIKIGLETTSPEDKMWPFVQAIEAWRAILKISTPDVDSEEQERLEASQTRNIVHMLTLKLKAAEQLKNQSGTAIRPQAPMFITSGNIKSTLELLDTTLPAVCALEQGKNNCTPEETNNFLKKVGEKAGVRAVMNMMTQ